jgi:hypothetical protein
MSEGAGNACETPVGLPAGAALLAKLSPWGLIVLDAGQPRWANARACTMACCANLDELARRWRKFASGWSDLDAPSSARTLGGVVDPASFGRNVSLRYEIHPVPDSPDTQLVVLKDRCEFSDHDAAIVLAGERRLATLYATRAAHDVRGGASEVRMALAAMDAVLKASAPNLADEARRMVADRMASAVSGCARSAAAVDALSADLSAASVPDVDVDLREIARRLPTMLLPPSLIKMISCHIDAGEVARIARGSERALRNGVACLALYLLERAVEDSTFTVRLESTQDSHAMLLVADALEDPGDPLDPDRPMLWIDDHALVPFYAGRLLLEAQGATLSRYEGTDGVGFCIAVPAARARKSPGTPPADGAESACCDDGASGRQVTG